MEKEITLLFNRKDFEDIIYANEDLGYYKNPKIKKNLIYTILFLGLLLGFIILERFENIPLTFYIWTVPLLLFFLISFIYTCYRVYKYRKSIKRWMDQTSKYKTYKVNVSDHSIAVIMDNEKTIQTWSSINYASLNEMRILLIGAEQFYIPSKSMSVEEYGFLKETVENKLKNIID